MMKTPSIGIRSAGTFALFLTAATLLGQYPRQFPELQNSRILRGGELLNMAQPNYLEALAAYYRKTPDQLRKQLTQDKSIRADRTGRLHYVCASRPIDPATGGGPTPSPGPFPYTQTFKLHSRPGAPLVVYLDFDGHTTSGTYWNSSYTNGSAIVSPSFSMDGDYANFSNTEHDTIQRVWMRVAEDFAPWEVDVCTEPPASVDALRRTSSTDVNYGVRVVVGGDSMTWLGVAAGGVAYLDCFDWDTDTPAFVFPAQLGNGNEKFVAEAASHEIGHTLGLSHDGTIDGTEYFAGTTTWAPIMGTGYYCDVVQWSKGDYTGASNTEDDLAMIRARIPLRSDQHGDDILRATPLGGTSPTGSGIIERTADADLFSFSTAAGPITLTANPAQVSPNLDIGLSLFDGAGNLIANTVNQIGMGSTLSLNVAQGTYYLAVDGVGTSAYSDYASLGQYSLAASLVGTTNQPPVAKISPTSATISGTAPFTVNFSGTGSSDPDGSIVAYDWDFGDGTTSTSPTPSKTYSTAGTFVASLVVFDNSGLSSSASITVSVTQGPQAPIAVTSSTTPLSGFAPLAVTFSSAGSYDPDGTITKYAWSFSNKTTATTANVSKSFSTPGTYTGTLTVTDNTGRTGTSTVSIVVKNPKIIYISDISMSVTGSLSLGYTGQANVTVKDVTGKLVGKVTTTGNWSNLVTVTGARATTGTSGSLLGVAVLKTSAIKKAGTFTFTPTNLSLSGYTYDKTLNLKTSGSINTP
jgi:PKD repeat protein